MHLYFSVEKSNSGSYFQEKPEFLILRAKCYNITEEFVPNYLSNCNSAFKIEVILRSN